MNSQAKHRSGTKKFNVETTINKETGREDKLLVGKYVICGRKKSMIVSDNTIRAEGLGDFFKNLGKKGRNVSKKMVKNVLSNPGRALDLTAKIAKAAVSKTSKQALSTIPELIKFYNTERGLYLGKFVCIILYKWTRRRKNYTHLHP